jgi:hypothetical protein
MAFPNGAAMRYTKFSITNFKGVRSLELDLAKPPRANVFALVGLNESGKTTILEACDWLYSPDRYEPHALIPKSELSNFNGKVSVTAEFEFSDSDELLINDHLRKLGFKVAEPVRGGLLTRNQIYASSALSSEQLIWTLKVQGKKKRQKSGRVLSDTDPIFHDLVKFLTQTIQAPIIYYQNFLFDFPEKIYIARKDGTPLAPPAPFYKAVIQDVLNSMGKDLTIESHLTQRFLSGKTHDVAAMESVLYKLAAKIETEVFTAWKQLLKISGEGLSITLGQTLESDEDGIYLQLKVKEGDQTYQIKERSLGFRWFFAFVLLTHFRSYRQKTLTNAVFLLDEPASNLHPTAQTKLLSAFDKLPNNQTVIYATHSHHMINPRWLAGTFVVKNQAKEYSDLDVKYNSFMTDVSADHYFRFVASYPQDTDYFRPILDALDYQPSKLELVPNLVIVEGKNDYYSLRYLQEIIIRRQENAIHFYPSTGKDKTDYIAALYLAWGRPFIVALDDDKGGHETKRRLTRDFGPIMEAKIFLLGDIHARWKGFSHEDLFTKKDQINIIQTIYPASKEYDKSKFNLGIQDCLINSRRLDLYKTTLNNFDRLLSFLDRKLRDQD